MEKSVRENVSDIVVLCIPKLEVYISREFIVSCFEEKDIGCIEKIIELPHKNNPLYKRIILHIVLSEESENAKLLRGRFSEKKDVKLVYKFPWYWKVVEANNIRTPQIHATDPNTMHEILSHG